MKIKTLAIVVLAFVLCLGFTQPMEAGFNLGGIKIDLPGGGGRSNAPGRDNTGNRVYYAKCDLPGSVVSYDFGQNLQFKMIGDVLMINKPTDGAARAELEGENLRVSIADNNPSDSGIVYTLGGDHFFTFKIPLLPGGKLALVRHEGSIHHREIDYNNRYFN